MSKIVLVTGANRGLGYSIIEVAGARDPSAIYVLCSRSLEAGVKAKEKLEMNAFEATIDVLQLDVTNDDQILDAVRYVGQKYGKLDVLINNAGIISIVPDMSLPTLRQCCNDMFNVNSTSAAVVASAFLQLLHKGCSPRVINITSGLGSFERTLSTEITRYLPYGFSKVDLNGVTAHLQAMENDRVTKAGTDATASGYVRFFSVAPGLLKTAFTGYMEAGTDPKIGAEVVAQLIADDDGKYNAGSHLEWSQGEMRNIPW